MHPLDASLIQRRELEEAYRDTQMRLAWQAYRGQLPPPLKTSQNQPNHSVQVNFAGLIIDKAADALFGKDLGIQIDTAKLDEADAYLKKIWPPERRAVDLLKCAMNGGIFGHAFLEVSIRENGLPRVTVLDTQCMTAEPSDYDLDELEAVRHTWTTKDKDGRPLAKRRSFLPTGTGWEILTETSYSNTRGWVADGAAVPWNYTACPVQHCQNWVAPNELYGWPDLPMYVIELIRAIARLDSIMNKIVMSHSSPLVVVKGVRPNQRISKTGEGFLSLADVNSTIELISLEGDLPAAHAMRKQLVEDLHSTTHVPQITVSKTESIGQATSGRAMQILYGPLLARTRTKRRLYGEMVCSVVKLILEIGGYPESSVSLQWPELIPTDPIEDRNAALLDQQLGVAATQTLAGKLGYEWSKEKPLIDQEAAEQRDAAITDQNFGFA